MTGAAGGWDAIGVFGGTFDPIHFGHLRTAFECRARLGLREVRFVPCRIPPHRETPVAPAAVRLQMVEAAVAGVDGFVADARELDRAGPSYTIDTLASLRQDYPDSTLCLLLGLDAFTGLAGWRDWMRLAELAHIVVARRPGAAMPAAEPLSGWIGARLATLPESLRTQPSGLVYFTDVTQLDIASTDLRASIAAGVKPVYLLPEAVWDVIVAQGCYGA